MTEDVLVHVRTHPKVLVRPAIVQIALLACHIGLAVLWPAAGFGLAWVDAWGQAVLHGLIALLEIAYSVIPVLRWWLSTYTVTTLRVSRQWGILLRRSYEIPIDRIVSITTERSLLDRIFRCGTLVLHDAGYAPNTAAGVRFHDVPKVEEIRGLLDDLKYRGAP